MGDIVQIFSNESTAEQKLPTLFEAHNALLTLARHRHVKVQKKPNDPETLKNSIDQQFLHILSSVMPRTPIHKDEKFSWIENRHDMITNILPALRDYYTDFPEIISSLQTIEPVLENKNWRNFFEQHYTLEKAMERRIKIENAFNKNTSELGYARHSSYDNSEDAQNHRELLKDCARRHIEKQTQSTNIEQWRAEHS